MEKKDVQTHTFTSMDSDTAAELLEPNKARYLLNVNCYTLGKRGIITNTKGNLQIPFPLPEGECLCIGKALDEENNKFYFLIWNAAGKHGLYQYDKGTNSVTRLLENFTDTGNVDIMGLDKNHLVLHFKIIKGRAYWVDGLNNARKTNIAKLLDDSEAGYGGLILQSYIDAYKQTAPYAPVAAYASDLTKTINKLYGGLRKFATRYVYDDGEVSNWSDFSAVPLPDKEPFTGVNVIPTNNNCIDVTFNTGDRTVVKIEVSAMSTSYSLTGDDGITSLPWGIIATINKKRLKLTDNSPYTYRYFNDTAPLSTSQEKINRPYSYLPRAPWCMAFVKRALTYTNFKEGFPNVDIDIDASVGYNDLFIEDGVENDFNDPDFTIVFGDSDYVSGGEQIIYFNNIQYTFPRAQGPARFNIQTITVGSDVKKGNVFTLNLTSGGGDNFVFTYTANQTDTAATVANNFKQQLIATERVYRKTEELPERNIYDNTIDGDGNVSFSYIMRAGKNQPYLTGSTNVTPVQYATLKDTGESIRNIKLGSSSKYGIMYEDYDGRKSLTYTSESLVVDIKPINELGGYKAPLITLQINHTPPKWARRYQIVRSPDLVYGTYIQMLIQKINELNNEDTQDFLDLIVGSLFTFQKIHPNSPLKYEFKKGDRIRLLKKVDSGDYYSFFETEIVAYNPLVEERIRSNVSTSGTDTVTVAATNADNIGKFMVIEGSEREIIGAPSSTTYQLNNSIGDGTAKTYLFYDIVDRRGSVRIRKPADITIVDNTLVEIFTPAAVQNSLSSIQFNEFQKKFEIINPGTDNAYHAGNTQDQGLGAPALVTINEGVAYVRNRPLPLNNVFPGTQQAIEAIEDQSYSDYYDSLINDNGRVNTEDTGDGEVSFGSRVRVSNNFIEDTRINGLNDFDNLDREDYNDENGDVMLTVFNNNRIYLFKKLRNAYVTVGSRLTQDTDGQTLNVGTSKILNDIQYFAMEDGGVGDHPESFAQNNTQMYLLAQNKSQIIRIGGNGEEPISETFMLDKDCSDLISEAVRNGAKIMGGFEKSKKGYIISIQGYDKYIFFDGFNSWVLQNDVLPDSTTFEIVLSPVHGTAVLSGGFNINYTPNNNYIGSDSFTYRALIGGVWSTPKKVCFTINDVPQQLAWRAIDPECVVESGSNTGYQKYNTLEQYNTFDNVATGVTKPNVYTDPDYVMPVYNTFACPVVPPEPGTYHVTLSNKTSKPMKYYNNVTGAFVGNLSPGAKIYLAIYPKMEIAVPLMGVPVWTQDPDEVAVLNSYHDSGAPFFVAFPDSNGLIQVGGTQPPFIVS